MASITVKSLKSKHAQLFSLALKHLKLPYGCTTSSCLIQRPLELPYLGASYWNSKNRVCFDSIYSIIALVPRLSSFNPSRFYLCLFLLHSPGIRDRSAGLWVEHTHVYDVKYSSKGTSVIRKSNSLRRCSALLNVSAEFEIRPVVSAEHP